MYYGTFAPDRDWWDTLTNEIERREVEGGGWRVCVFGGVLSGRLVGAGMSTFPNVVWWSKWGGTLFLLRETAAQQCFAVMKHKKSFCISYRCCCLNVNFNQFSKAVKKKQQKTTTTAKPMSRCSTGTSELPCLFTSRFTWSRHFHTDPHLISSDLILFDLINLIGSHFMFVSGFCLIWSHQKQTKMMMKMKGMVLIKVTCT